MSDNEEPTKPRTSGAMRVLLGIFASRAVGFLRDRALAFYFGAGAHADVFRTALRAPNLLQNLLGEGTISAAFIPIYSRMVDDGREEDGGRFAGAVLGLLLATVTTLVLLGVLLARPLVAMFASGFLGDADAVAAGSLTVDRFELTVSAVRVIFPMTGVLVLSAWALGILNSHRRFFLAYLAPVLWNVAIMAALLLAGRTLLGDGEDVIRRTGLLEAACIGALVGAVLQFAVQLPLVVRLLRGFRLSLSARVDGVQEALAAFGPVVAGRGVVQLSGYLDLWLASWLHGGAIAAIGWAQALYMLPVSLFGMSVAAAELPELARASEQDSDALLERIRRSLGQMSFLTIPTAVGYLAFGSLIVGALYRTGSFGADANALVYLVLVGYTLGLIASTSSRLLQNVFYAFRDTRTPARIAAMRVALSTSFAIPLMLWLDTVDVAQLPGQSLTSPLHLGAVGLTSASAIGAWLELSALLRALRKRGHDLSLPLGRTASLAGIAAVATIPAALVWYVLPQLHVIITTVLVVGPYAATYLTLTHLAGMSEAATWLGRIRRRRVTHQRKL